MPIFVLGGVVRGSRGSHWLIIVRSWVLIIIIRVKGECRNAGEIRELGVRG
jgi:hypothetical protein